METEQFNEIVQERVDASLKGLVKKATEYAGPSDRLHNFKVAAVLGSEGENQSQALAGMMKKHTVSVYDMINSGEAYSEEMWDEKIGDHINYLLLLRATIVEDELIELIEEPEPLAEWEKALLKRPKIVWDAKDHVEVTLTHDEELAIFAAVNKIVAGRIPLIAGVGTNDTRDSVEFVKEVAELGYIDAGLAVTPYYNKPSQEGIYQHFKAIATASDLPIILYNIPGRVVTEIQVETILRLAELENVIAIKECTNTDNLAYLIEKLPKDFLVYTGEDGLAFHTKALGGQGVISVASHILGQEFFEMFAEIDQGSIQKAAAIQRKILPKINALFSVTSPAPIKTVLNAKGYEVGGLRLPLVACTTEESKIILEKIGN